MDKKAIISIKSNASMSDGEIIEVISPGRFVKYDKGYKAIYEETEISGMEGTTTTLFIDKGQVILEREGTTETKMLFNEKENSISLYNTPFGVLELSINTKKLMVELDDKGGEIEINYSMAIAGQEPLETSLALKVRCEN